VLTWRLPACPERWSRAAAASRRDGPAKLSRATLAVSNALVPWSRHVEQVERAGIRAPLFYELECPGADEPDVRPGDDESAGGRVARSRQ
jgi:hypothetical protein